MLGPVWLAGLAVAAEWPSLMDGGDTGYRARADSAVILTIEDHGEEGARLPTIAADGALVARTLEEARGVRRVRWLRSELTRDAMLDATRRAARKAREGGVVWVYVQGFGTLDPESGERWIVASDAEDAFTELGLAGCGADPSDPLAVAARREVRSHVVSVSELRDAAASEGNPVVMVVETVPAAMDCTLAGLAGGTTIPREPLPVPNTLVWTDRGGRAEGWSIVQWSVGHMGLTWLFAATLRGWPDGYAGAPNHRVTVGEAVPWVEAAGRAFGASAWAPMMPQAQNGLSPDLQLAVGRLEPMPELGVELPAPP